VLYVHVARFEAARLSAAPQLEHNINFNTAGCVTKVLKRKQHKQVLIIYKTK
jgi:hypothetical protein